MIGNYYTLRLVAQNLDKVLPGDAITDIISQEKDELAVLFRQTRGALVVSCGKETNSCFLHPSFSRARRNTVSIFPECRNARVHRVTIHASDRTLTFSLDQGYNLIAQLYGNRANIFLVQGEFVVSAFKRSSVLTGTRYSPPATTSPCDLTALDTISRSPDVPSALLRSLIPAFGPLLTQEAIVRAGVEDSPGPQADPVPARLRHAVVGIFEDLDNPRPHLYRDPAGVPVLLSPIPLVSQPSLHGEAVDDIHTAIRTRIFGKRSAGAFRLKQESLRTVLSRHLERLERTQRAIRADMDGHSRAADYEHTGAFLMANLPAFPPGASEARVTINGEERVVALDRRLTPARNAQRYFEKAKRARLARVEAADRLQEIAGRTGRLSQLLQLLATIVYPEELQEFLKERGMDLKKFGVSEKGEPREVPLFRVFVVDGGFEVWAGKSSENNDLLTLRHARPNDLWFHARGASGSHVVLRVSSAKGTPGKRAKEQAAAIAAYYSKMRNARLVPVAVTERKYVRKPKGAPAGTVALDRERVLMVAPALPQPSED